MGRFPFIKAPGVIAEKTHSRQPKGVQMLMSNQFRNILAVCLLIFFAKPILTNVQADSILEVGQFSVSAPKDQISEHWQPLTFKKIENHTTYELVEKNGKTVIKAESKASASGLIREISIDLGKYPWIAWSWKVENIFEKGDVTQKEGDDYPARIYITFVYDPDRLSFFERVKYKAASLFYGQNPPHAAINYIWASKAPVGTILPNPYTDRVKMIVVESGGENIGVWQNEKRNVYKDYENAFGEKPPMISGVAIMTDSDDTGESAVAYYGDILFMAEPR